MKAMRTDSSGPERIVFGANSVWYGTPQWQIEALWRAGMPPEARGEWSQVCMRSNSGK